MTQSLILGLGLLAVSGFHLIPAVLTDEIPARWPVKPLTRSAKPTQFKITFWVFAAAGALGAILVAAAILRHFVEGP